MSSVRFADFTAAVFVSSPVAPPFNGHQRAAFVTARTGAGPGQRPWILQVLPQARRDVGVIPGNALLHLPGIDGAEQEGGHRRMGGGELQRRGGQRDTGAVARLFQAR